MYTQDFMCDLCKKKQLKKPQTHVEESFCP